MSLVARTTYLWGSRGRCILGVPDSDVVDSSSVCEAGKQLAAIQTNLVDHALHLAWRLAWQARPGKWPLGRSPWTRHRERFAVAHVQRRQWESGCHEPHRDTLRRWLVGDELVLHVDSE